VGNEPTAPVIAYDKTLYAGSGNGRLYAVSTDSAGIDSGAQWPMLGHDVRHTSRNIENEGPTAYAGDDRNVTGGDTITLDASGSTDSDYGIAHYQWQQISGDSVTLSDADTLSASFKAPVTEKDIPLIFELTVTDFGGKTATDTLQVTVEEDNSFCFIRTSAPLFLYRSKNHIPLYNPSLWERLHP
jgi:hypothetical protein